jgi:hypothetical protein
MFIAVGTKKLFLSEIVTKTVESINAVVRLSANGERKNDKNQSIQNNCL